MKKIAIALFLTVIFVSFQSPVDKALLTGTWKLSSHFYVEDTKKITKHYCDLTDYSPEITLMADGSYSVALKGKTIQKGKWKINSGNTLFYYNNQDVPDDPKVTIADHGVAILMLDKESLMLREVGCNEAIEGKSTYTKMK